MQKLLGEKLYNIIFDQQDVTEIRLRAAQKILVKTFQSERFIGYVTSLSELQDIVQRAMHFSPYAYEDEISAGFLHYEGGVRIGICGKGKYRQDGKISLPIITSLCIRIPHEIIGVAEKIGIFYDDFQSTLVIGPPYSGKTTLIRDMARILSDKLDTLYVDERSELIPENKVVHAGKRADIIRGIPKKNIYENIIRAMNPQIVICDELFSQEDFESVRHFIRAGIKCLASFHCDCFEKIPPTLKENFNTLILLSDKPKVGTLKAIRRADDN